MAKMKLKTLSGAKKRFKMTASGKIKRNASKPKTSRPANSGAGDLERMKKIYDKVRRG